MRKSASFLALGSACSALLAASFFTSHSPAPVTAAEEENQIVHSAPEAKENFMDITCDPPTEIGQIPELAPMSWWAPSLNTGASFTPSENLPSSATSNDGIIYSHSEEIGASQGVSLLVGHVDFEPGVISEAGGELTSWGQLHQLSKCDLIFATDSKGEVKVAQITSLYTAPQFDEELEQRAAAYPDDVELQQQLQHQREIQERIFRSSGPYTITLLTCSGPSVADVGGPFQFRYRDNLIIETSPIYLSHEAT